MARYCNLSSQMGTSRDPIYPALTVGEDIRLRGREVATLGGCSHRQLRELVELGLVNRAVGKGHAARYLKSHVEQLQGVLQALQESKLSKQGLRWVLDRDTPNRLRRQAIEVERLGGPLDGHERLDEVTLDLGLRLAATGTFSVHHQSTVKRVLASVAVVLRDEADRVEALRRSLSTTPKVQPPR